MSSRRVLITAALAALATLAGSRALPGPPESGRQGAGAQEPGSPAAAGGDRLPDAAVALAGIDSLLARGAAGEGAERALLALRRWGQDPLYGWQLAGRAGSALVAAGRPGEALAHLEAAIGAQPGDGALRHQLGLALAALGRRGRALAEFEQAALLDPAAVAPRLEAGRLRGALGDVEGAARELAAATAACGGCPGPDRLLATILLEAGRPAEAVAPLRRLLDAGGEAQVRINLLAALSRAGEDSALLALVDGRDAVDWSADDWRQAVQSEARLGKADRAARALVLAAAKPAPPGLPAGDDVFWGAAAASLLAAGMPRLSLEAGDRALALHPGSRVYLTNRAAALVAIGRHDEARRALAEADAVGAEGARQEGP